MYFYPMKSIALIGYGNLGQHLHTAVKPMDAYAITQICSPTQQTGLRDGIFYATSAELLKPADLYIIAVKDDAIQDVSQQLPQDAFVIHTSGAQPLSVLSRQPKAGVLYPLQSFSKDAPINFHEVPLFIEAKNEQELVVVNDLAAHLSKRVSVLNSEGRFQLHLTGVIVNNFVNHLYCQASALLKDQQLPFDLLHPLITETARKALNMDPHEAQTGPAKRKDLKTIQAHLAVLTDENQREIYKLLSRSISAYDKKTIDFGEEL